MARVTVSPGKLPYSMDKCRTPHGVVPIEYIRSKAMLADPFVKGLAREMIEVVSKG